jgi:3-methyl-2-oxobutanoate hydroxymethyltransferase
LQQGTDAALDAASRLCRDGGADLVKVDVAVSSVHAVRSMMQAGISVWAQLDAARDATAGSVDQLVTNAKLLEAAGAVMLDLRHSGPVAGPAVVDAVGIPVVGGLGGGPWLDGRVRSIPAAIGYLASSADGTATNRYANVAAMTLTALDALCDDVRAARPLRGEAAAPESR